MTAGLVVVRLRRDVVGLGHFVNHAALLLRHRRQALTPCIAARARCCCRAGEARRKQPLQTDGCWSAHAATAASMRPFNAQGAATAATAAATASIVIIVVVAAAPL